MIRVLAHHPQHGLRAEIPPAELPGLLGQEEWKMWVDLERLTKEEAAVLADVFHFHPLAIEDCETPRHHPKIDDYGDYLFLIVHGVTPETSHREFRTRELDLFLARRYLVTYHREKLRSIQAGMDACAKNSNVLASGPDFLMHLILDSLVDRYLPVVDVFAKAIEGIEDRIFHRPGAEQIDEILKVKRAIVRLRRISGHQREILHRLARGEFSQIQPRCAIYLRDVFDHLVRVTDLAEAYRELASGALEGYLSSVSVRLNETMKVLTVFATIFIPLTFIAGVYGMNFHYMPELEWKFGYLFAWGIMIGVGAGLYAYFRRRNLV